MGDETGKGLADGWAVSFRTAAGVVVREGEGEFDELIVNGWLRVEQLESAVYWIRVGDARLIATLGAEGRVTVDIQRGFYTEVDGTTTVHAPTAE